MTTTITTVSAVSIRFRMSDPPPSQCPHCGWCGMLSHCGACGCPMDLRGTLIRGPEVTAEYRRQREVKTMEGVPQ